LVDEKAGKVDRSILDIRYMNVYFTSTPSSTRVLDTGSVAKVLVTRNKSCGINGD
jgi:hypothetical protein